MKLFLSRPFIYKQTWNKEEVCAVEYKKPCSVIQAAHVQSKTIFQHCISKVMKQRKEN